MRIWLDWLAMVVMVSGCSVTMTPPGQNAAAPAQPPVETRVETKVVPVVERRSYSFDGVCSDQCAALRC